MIGPHGQNGIEIAPDYLKEEQKQRRAEIENLIKRMESDQRYGLLITGAVWSWLGTHEALLAAPFSPIIVAIPTVLMIFFYIRRRAQQESIDWVAAYTRTLEGKLLPDGFGWERYLENELRKNGRVDPLTHSTTGFWRLLVLTNALIGAGLLLLAPR